MHILTKSLLIAMVVLILMMQGCSEQKRGDRLPTPPRDTLSVKELMQSECLYTEPVDNRYFTPMGAWESAGHAFEGTLVVPEFVMANASAKADSARPWEYFPGFAVDFFTHEDQLVPTARETILVSGEKSYWQIILSPGKIWSERGDEGMSRASFPFALVNGDFNDIHNGLATFTFDDTRVSSLFLQVIQETSPVFKADYWGITAMTYSPHSLENRDVHVTRFREEVRLQVPILPFSKLRQTVDPLVLETFCAGITQEEISATGLLWNGTLYLQPCYTRYGEYPYCRHMRHAAYSLTKAMGALVALLRLAETYGDDVFALKVADYVPIKADHDGWADVTFADALNMATGVGDNLPERVEPNVMHGDEDQAKFLDFMRADTRKDKLAIAFSYANYPWGPGEVARYNSINTFMLSAAMDGFLKSNQGANADIWEMVRAEVFRPIGIAYAPIMRTLETDGTPGIPCFGYGLYPTVDDMAKLSILLQNNGRHQGRQILHAGRLAEAMFQTDVTGLPTGNSNAYGDFTYHLSFDGLPYKDKDGRTRRIPFSTGFGGNHWVLLPNGIATFRFCDANKYGIDSMVDVAEAICPFR